MAKTKIVMADKMNIACQPRKSATKLDKGRESIIPSNKPLMTLPTTRPREESEARYDAKGTSTCVATEPKPMTNKATKNNKICFVIAVVARATAVISKDETISFRFSRISPKGTINSKPAT
ncbi:hypothetical protein D3C79_875380 [compost metagenome]